MCSPPVNNLSAVGKEGLFRGPEVTCPAFCTRSFCPAAGEQQWRTVLRSVWDPFAQQLDTVASVAVREVIDELDAQLGPHLFPVQVISRQHTPRYSNREVHPLHVDADFQRMVFYCTQYL